MPNIARHFARTQLQDIDLSAQVVSEIGTPVRDVVMAMADADTSCAFVMDGSKITGILTEHDVAHRVALSPDAWGQPVDSFMTPDPYVVDKAASAMEALHIMRVNKIRNLPVVLDEAGHYANVTHYDLIVLASRYLESAAWRRQHVQCRTCAALRRLLRDAQQASDRGHRGHIAG